MAAHDEEVDFDDFDDDDDEYDQRRWLGFEFD